MRSARVDLYGVLGVARSATVADLRRAYREKALSHHPDRAGAASAAIFAGIADAYRVLSNPVARSAYDASLADENAWSAYRAQNANAAHGGGAVHAGGMDWNVSTNGSNASNNANRWTEARPVHVADLLSRVSGHIDALTAARIAALGADGVLELHLNAPEAAAGGTAAIQLPLKVLCASCGGIARPRGVWCRICQHDGQVSEVVTVFVRVPPYTHPGSVLSVPVSRAVDSPIKVRCFVHGLRPHRG